MSADANHPDHAPADVGRITNPPGLTALSYRLDTHPTFFERMRARLRGQAVPNVTQPPLAALTTRTTDDPAIALLDAWAVAADVLTFYQERIANEGYICTASERRSLLELARSIGYELVAGVAASTLLAFTVEDAPGAPTEVVVPQGTRVQSIPRPGQLPQTFETSTPLVARAAWNAIRPQLSKPQTTDKSATDKSTTNKSATDKSATDKSTIDKDATTLRLEGVATGLRPGDRLLILDSDSAWYFATLQSVDPLAKEGATQIRVAWQKAPTQRIDRPQVFALRQRTGFFGNNAPAYASLSTTALTSTSAAPGAPVSLKNFTNYQVLNAFNLASISPPEVTKLSVTGVKLSDLYREADLDELASLSVDQRAKVATVLQTSATTTKTGSNLYPTSWEGRSVWTDSQGNPLTKVYLDQSAAGIAPGSWTVFECPDTQAWELYQVSASNDLGITDYGMSARVTALSLANRDGAAPPTKKVDLLVRSTTAYLQSEALVLAGQPLDALITVRAAAQPSDSETHTIVIALERAANDLQVGQLLALSGELDENPGVMISEMVILTDVRHDDVTTLSLQSRQKRSYLPRTVTLNANIVLATHGETVAHEVLGSGDGSQINQRFKLARAPLTYVAAPTASGTASTLEIWVNGVRWSEIAALIGIGPRDQVYTLRRDDVGNTYVIFGDGINGARLPNGQENVVARYRCGLGLSGNVDAGSLTLLQTRPFGIRSVANPEPASGGASLETLHRARDIAPRSALTLGRLVSRQDYEDFARSFAGVGQAQATMLWDGAARLIYLSVADVAGTPAKNPSALLTALEQALHERGNPLQPVRVEGYTPRIFRVDAKVWVDRRYEADAVVADVRTALAASFAFERRSFGQDVTAADVLAVMQAVPGVVAVDLDQLVEQGRPAPDKAATPIWPVLRGRRARAEEDAAGQVQIMSAEMWLIDDQAGISITGVYAGTADRAGRERQA